MSNSINPMSTPISHMPESIPPAPAAVAPAPVAAVPPPAGSLAATHTITKGGLRDHVPPLSALLPKEHKGG